ncbi:unnamed protein product [Rhodiola kirilowii]
MGAKVSKLQLLQAQGYKRLEGSSPLPLVAPKGYIPFCVGADGEGRRRRYFVHTRILKRVEFLELLRRSEEEYGFGNESVVRVLYDADKFEKRIMDMKMKKRNMFKVRQPFIVSYVAAEFDV